MSNSPEQQTKPNGTARSGQGGGAGRPRGGPGGAGRPRGGPGGYGGQSRPRGGSGGPGGNAGRPRGGDGRGGDSRSPRGDRGPRAERVEARPTAPREQPQPLAEEKLEERVVDIARVAKVVKGGRHFNFRALVVVGDGSGMVGMGIGRAREVTDAIRKGVEQARKHMIKVPVTGSTIPHEVNIKYGAAQVMLKPASPGTGVIAGGGVRAVLEAAGIRDVLTKSLGSNNVLNVVAATLEGLQSLKEVETESQRRGKAVADVSPFWKRRSNG